MRTWTGAAAARAGLTTRFGRRTKTRSTSEREGAESAPGSSFHPPTLRAERRGLAASRLLLLPYPTRRGAPSDAAPRRPPTTPGRKAAEPQRAFLLPGLRGEGWPECGRMRGRDPAKRRPSPQPSPVPGRGGPAAAPSPTPPVPTPPSSAGAPQGAGSGIADGQAKGALATLLDPPSRRCRAAGDDGALEVSMALEDEGSRRRLVHRKRWETAQARSPPRRGRRPFPLGDAPIAVASHDIVSARPRYPHRHLLGIEGLIAAGHHVAARHGRRGGRRVAARSRRRRRPCAAARRSTSSSRPRRGRNPPSSSPASGSAPT